MPTRRSGESRAAFLARCMADPEARRDFPKATQRYAFCQSQADAPQEDACKKKKR